MARRYSHRPLFPNPVVSFFLFWLGYILNGSTLPPSVTFCTARYAYLWRACGKRKLTAHAYTKPARNHETQQKDGDGDASGNDGPANCGIGDAAGRKRDHCDQRGARGAGDRRLEVYRLEVGGAAARTWRAGEGASSDRIFFGESAGHSHGGHAAATTEGRPVREAHLSFFESGFDESRGAGIGTRGRAGGRGYIGGRTDGRAM